MFTLLPEEQKKLLLKEYRLRLLTAIIFMIAVFLIFSFCIILSSYLPVSASLSEAKVTDKQIAMEIEKGNSGQLAEVLGDIRNNLSAALPVEKSISPILEKLNEKKPASISLTLFQYRFLSQSEGGALAVSGRAENRVDLLAFEQALEREPLFKQVEFPISNLAKEKDINFSITIKGAF